MTSKQAPIRSGFGPITTARQTLKSTDRSGKVAIVAGYSGIGLETTRAPGLGSDSELLSAVIPIKMAIPSCLYSGIEPDRKQGK
jgi:hypothetical protein